MLFNKVLEIIIEPPPNLFVVKTNLDIFTLNFSKEKSRGYKTIHGNIKKGIKKTR